MDASNLKLYDLLIWWLCPSDLMIICRPHNYEKKLPKYIKTEIDSAYGRNGRGRLWVNEYIQKDFEDGHICVDEKYWKGMMAECLYDYCGIVIRTDDYKLVKDYPGIFTDFTLDRYPDYRICGK